MKFQHLFFILTQKLKHILAYKRSFWCDGHPWLCVACIRFRYGIMYGSMPVCLEILSNRGSFIWAKDEALDLPEYWQWLEGILIRHTKQKQATRTLLV